MTHVKGLAQCPAHSTRMLSCVQFFVTPWTVARQAPLLMGFSRQGYWSELPFPPPSDLPDPGIEPVSPGLEGGFFTTEPPGKPQYIVATQERAAVFIFHNLIVGCLREQLRLPGDTPSTSPSVM